MRKGQITGFILAGLLIVFLFASVYLVMGDVKWGTQQEFTPETFTQHCLKIGTEQALHILARHGEVPNSITPIKPKPEADELCISVTTSQGELTLDNLTTIQQELPKIINENFLNCLADFETIKKQNYQVVELQPPNTEVTFTPEKLIVKTMYDVEFTRQGKTDQLNDLFLSMQSEYKEIHQTTNKAAEIYTQTKEIPIEEFNKNAQTALITPDEQGIIITAIDDSSNLYQPTNYTFSLR